MNLYPHTYDLALDRSRTFLAEAEARRMRTRPTLGERLSRRLAGRGRPATTPAPRPVVTPVPATAAVEPAAVADPGERVLVGVSSGADER